MVDQNLLTGKQDAFGSQGPANIMEWNASFGHPSPMSAFGRFTSGFGCSPDVAFRVC
jgi:hypothetical protein